VTPQPCGKCSACVEIDGGRFPAKAVAGESVTVEADVFGEGHDTIDAALLYRRKGAKAWTEAPMAFHDNDRWRGRMPVAENATYEFTLIAWRDLFAAWRSEVSKKHAADQSIALELTEGRQLGLNGTPSFFFGLTLENDQDILARYVFRGALPYKDFKKVLEELLQHS